MQRSDRIAEEIKKLIAEALRTGVKDPRIPLLTSVNKVDLNRDLSLATVYVSTMGSETEKSDLMAGLEKAKGFLRRFLASELRLRVVPELRFRLDESMEISARMSKLIDEVIKADEERSQERKQEPSQE